MADYKSLIESEDFNILMMGMPSGFKGIVDQAASNIDLLIDSKIDEFESEAKKKIDNLVEDEQFKNLQVSLESNVKAWTGMMADITKETGELNGQLNSLIRRANKAGELTEELETAVSNLQTKVSALEEINQKMAKEAGALGKSVVDFVIAAGRRAVGLS